MKNRSASSDTGLTLALNAAEGVLQIAFADAGGKFLFGQGIEAPSRGAEILTPIIRHALTLLERRPGDIRRIAAVSGPGSFTGLRLTAATAAGLARATGAKQASLNHMDILARQSFSPLWQAAGKSLLCCLMRARRDLVYARCFTYDAGAVPPYRAVTDLAVLSVASGDLARHIMEAAAGEKAARVFLAGTGAHENRDALLSQLSPPEAPQAVLLDVIHPAPATLIAAALETAYMDKDIEPLYVRVSDAEENLPKIAVRLGMDPDRAVAKLHALTNSIPEDLGE